MRSTLQRRYGAARGSPPHLGKPVRVALGDGSGIDAKIIDLGPALLETAYGPSKGQTEEHVRVELQDARGGRTRFWVPTHMVLSAGARLKSAKLERAKTMLGGIG